EGDDADVGGLEAAHQGHEGADAVGQEDVELADAGPVAAPGRLEGGFGPGIFAERHADSLALGCGCATGRPPRPGPCFLYAAGRRAVNSTWRTEEMGMSQPDLLQFTQDVGVAAVLGAVIGLERQIRHHSAGLRTNALVCAGAAMFVAMPRLLGDDK